MPYPVSQRFLDTLASSDQKRISRVEVWNNNTLLTPLGNTTDGNQATDITQQIRRTCTATVESQGLDYDDLVPTGPTSLLHPSSGNELHLWRGFQYTDGTEELCPLGVFRMTTPTITDTGTAITIGINGNDRSALMTKRGWTDVYTILGGTPIDQAVYNIFQFKMSDLDLVYKITPTPGLTVPATTFGTDLSGSNDPMADAITLAAAASMELFFDETGALVMQPIPTPANTQPSFESPNLYQEGQNATFFQAERLLDETSTYNGVVVTGTGPGGVPVRAELWNWDPSSPTYVGVNGVNKQGYFYETNLIPATGQSTASATAQCLSIAQALYTQVVTLLETPSFQAVPNSSLLESDVLNLLRSRIALSGLYLPGQINMPLDIATYMQVTARTKVILPPVVPNGS